MTHSSEMGVIIEFVESTIDCPDHDTLTAQIFAALSSYGLSGSVAIRATYDQCGFDVKHYSNALLSPLETQLLDLSRDGARIVTLGRRAIFNTPSATLLIKDMPESDPDRCGRLKDHLAIILSCVESRLKALANAEIARQYRSSSINEILIHALLNASQITEKLKQIQSESRLTVNQVSQKLQSALISLMLPEHEEDLLLGLIAEASMKYESVIDVIAELDTLIEALAEDLRGVAL